ncbi:MAG TPA: ATP phosphoribosyltransferase [Microbacteriaceae bacterium]|nr:ATP phosphoribosyltransferase [Microbacteriaceae bacterium]
MLRIAVPNKGTLSETAVHMLHEAGYATRRDSRELVVSDPRNEVEFFYLRPRDIAAYVGSGALDVGITGRDLLIDAASDASELLELDFGASTFRFAAPEGAFRVVADLDGRRIATSYPGLVGSFLRDHGVSARLVGLEGAVESAVRLGLADAVADVVSTGTTLRSAGLAVFGPVILESTAVLIGSSPVVPAAETFIRRIQGVMLARQYVLIDYDIPKEQLAKATALTPGFESPTVSPLQDEAWVAVRAMIPASDRNQVMDALYAVGARAILVTAIHAARL